jgi:CRP-like cAMP-binding protein
MTTAFEDHFATGTAKALEANVGGAHRVAMLLEEVPEFGDGLGPARLAAATRDARALSMLLPRGAWAQPEWPPSLRLGLGLLVLDGLLLRRVGVDGRFGAELLAGGDLLRPWQREDAVASVPRRSGLQVLQRSRIALLDVDFTRRIAPYPEIAGQLVARALRRSRQLAVNMAIVHQPKVETRLHMLLWQLADRWGTVRPDGVLLSVRLTHVILAELVAARRPTVSAALGALDRAGTVSRVPGGWLLHGSPPGELQAIVAPSRA